MLAVIYIPQRLDTTATWRRDSMPNCAASPWTEPNEKTPGNERSRALRQQGQRRRATNVPATSTNASGRFEFPHSGNGTDRGGTRFRQQRHGVDHGRASEDRAIAQTRPLKNPRKNTRKPATRKTNSTPRKASPKQASPRRWSQRVTKESDALDIKHGIFKLTDPKKIAASLKRSAERSSRRKTGVYRSALSVLTFYINRAGKTLPKTQRDRLQRAKTELKRQFGKD
jgi:Protein of unknown function (DUF3175)